VGNPELASREKGEAFFTAICKKIGDLMTEIALADTDNLYE
jgi:hypothetical protein